jgi:hypothetical protein
VLGRDGGRTSSPTMAPNPTAAPEVRINRWLTGLKTAPAVTTAAPHQ